MLGQKGAVVVERFRFDVKVDEVTKAWPIRGAGKARRWLVPHTGEFDPTAATMKCLFRGQVNDPATSRRIFPPRCACATASLMEDRG
jgi:hypothetical protein